MSIEYQAFDPSSCRFPGPKAPVLTCRVEIAAGSHLESALPSSLSAGQSIYFIRGHNAVAVSYRQAGLDNNDAILAKACHCVTLIDQSVALGADILFYLLSPALTPEMKALDRMLERSLKPVKMLLATHYFGFARAFSDRKQWCVACGIRLVEDCSLGLMAESFRVTGAGEPGDLIASSSFKFSPCADGGWLNTPDAREIEIIETASLNCLAELRGFQDPLDKGRQAQVAVGDILELDHQVAQITQQSLDYGTNLCCTRNGHSLRSGLRHEAESALRSSRWLIRHSRVPDFFHDDVPLSALSPCHLLRNDFVMTHVLSPKWGKNAS